MIIGHPRRINDVEVSEPLKRIAKTKSLGVVVDEGLNWDNQLSKVKGKMNGGLRSLRKLKTLFHNLSLTMYTAPSLKVICDMLMLFGGVFQNQT